MIILSHLLGCQKKEEKCLWGPLRSGDIDNSQSLVGTPEEGREMFMGSTEIQRSSKFSVTCWDARRRKRNVYGEH